MTDSTLIFYLNISAKQYELYYTGKVSQVVAKSVSGQSLQFPARCLRPFVTYDGIQGMFEIRFNENQKLIDFKRIDT